MKLKRIFRLDFKPLNSPYRFAAGDVATVTEMEKSFVKIKVNNKDYILPYRDFMVSTRSAV